MSLEREIQRDSESPENREPTAALVASLFGQLLGDRADELEDLPGPSAAELEALGELEEPSPDELAALENLVDLDEPLLLPPVIKRAPAAQLAIAEPELVSLESLDDAESVDTLDEELEEEDDFLDELLDDIVDIDLDDDELDDEGYDLDDEEIDNYHALYGDDDSIVPSFREGEIDEEDEDSGDIAFYDDLR